MVGFNKLSKKDVLDNLKTLDEYLTHEGLTDSIIIVGGSALVLRGVANNRFTTDIDYLGKIPLEDSILRSLGLSNDVESIFTLPAPEELSLEKLEGFQSLDVGVISWMDLAITKTFSDRDKDFDDLYRYILKNLSNFRDYFSAIKHYKPDYPFNLDNMNLNLNDMERLMVEFRKEHGIVTPIGDETLGDFLVRLGIESDFMLFWESRRSGARVLKSLLNITLPSFAVLSEKPADRVIVRLGLQGIISELSRSEYRS